MRSAREPYGNREERKKLKRKSDIVGQGSHSRVRTIARKRFHVCGHDVYLNVTP